MHTPSTAALRFNGDATFIETDTGGMPTSIFFDAFEGFDPAGSVMEHKTRLAKSADHVRVALTTAPDPLIFLAFVRKSPRRPGVLEVIFGDDGGYLNMCGHGIMGLCTAIVELNWAGLGEKTQLKLETPAGDLDVSIAGGAGGKVASVSLVNVPCFVLRSSVTVDVPELGRSVTGCIAFGGSFFFLTPVASAGEGAEISMESQAELRRAGLAIRKAVNEKVKVAHPDPHVDITTVDLVEFYGPPSPESGADVRNAVVFGDGHVRQGGRALGRRRSAGGEIAPRGRVRPRECVRIQVLSQARGGGDSGWRPRRRAVQTQRQCHHQTNSLRLQRHPELELSCVTGHFVVHIKPS